MRFLGDYVFFGNATDHARCPYLTRLANGRLILGMNILRGQTRLTHDWNSAQRPHFIIGRTPEELAATPPTPLSDRHGLPPYFFERSDGVLLVVYFSRRTPYGPPWICGRRMEL